MATTEGFHSGTSVEHEERQKQRAAEAYEDVKERAAEARTKMADAKEKITDAYERTSQTAGRLYRDALDYGREHPGTAILVAFGAGVGLGAMLADGGRESRYRRNIVPAIATAMAEAVLDIFDAKR
jgi:ElaB/YqjD/DUF883 family membrane-anchored ribosome-binding protein